MAQQMLAANPFTQHDRSIDPSQNEGRLSREVEPIMQQAPAGLLPAGRIATGALSVRNRRRRDVGHAVRSLGLHIQGAIILTQMVSVPSGRHSEGKDCISGLPHALERRRPRHPHPVSQNRLKVGGSG